MNPHTCGYRFELANGETVTPCHLPAGHTGQHEGYCLGTKATWTSDKPHDSEEEQYHEASRMNPHTATLYELRDWLAKEDGWVYLDRKIAWRKKSMMHDPCSNWGHPYPPTLDGAASAMPEGWWWQRDQGTEPNPQGLLLKWVACQIGSDRWKIVETRDTGDEITDRYRLAALCVMAEKESKHGN